MKKTEIQALKEILSEPKKIVVIPHKNPDGDAIGAALALFHYLKAKEHLVCVISPNDYPDFLKWMPGESNVLKFEQQNDLCVRRIQEADLIFTVDFNALSRIEEMQPLLESVKAQFVLIDHHQQPDNFAQFVYSDTGMSSTCEMIYHFLDFLGDTDAIDFDIATCLYTGIMTDTGSFRFPSTTSGTHKVIAFLMERGANNARIYESVFDTNTTERLHLLGCALKNLVLLEEYHTVYITLRKEELEQFNFKKGDTEGFVNYGLSLKGVKFSIIFIENTGDGEPFIKISLRSKGDFSVNDFARTHYNGGGHINAAGGRSDAGMDKTISDFLNILTNYKTELG